MTVAFWCQLAVAGLLVVLAMVNAVVALLGRQLLADTSALSAGELLSCGLLLCLAAWLVVAAFGLRRRSRAAYGSSLAGLVLPLLFAAVSVLGVGTTSRQTFSSIPTGGRDVFAVAERLAIWTTLSHAVNEVAAIIGPLLVVTTIGALATRTCRRFFVGSVGPDHFR
ncbi:hypothetical protein ACIA5D_20160 [Actinoplanes sp. NPDC051513]|uniref:hypothetical protein n=1 Tax=Actinoplanes sp. NPDC051513 TaxID=3363908 RepID=UPI0037985214